MFGKAKLIAGNVKRHFEIRFNLPEKFTLVINAIQLFFEKILRYGE